MFSANDLKKKISLVIVVSHILDTRVPIVVYASLKSKSKKNHDRSANKCRDKVVD